MTKVTKNKKTNAVNDNAGNTQSNITIHNQNNNLADYTPQYVLDSDAKDSGKIITSKYEFDLFYKEDDISYAVFRVKYLKSPHHHWNLMKNNKIVASLPEAGFSDKEIKILHSATGFLQLLELAKCSDITNQIVHTKIKSWLDAQG